MQIHRNTHILAHTFPGGDESCQELAEVGSGVCIFLTQRKSFQLGGRAPVLDVGIIQGEGVSLEESCSTQTETHKQQMILKLAAGLKKGLTGLLGTCTFRGGRDGALALLKELGREREPKTARTQDCQHDTHTQPCSHLKERENREREKEANT